MTWRVWVVVIGVVLSASVFGYWREARAASEIDKLRENAVCLARMSNEHFWVLVDGSIAWCPDCGESRRAKL